MPGYERHQKRSSAPASSACVSEGTIDIDGAGVLALNPADLRRLRHEGPPASHRRAEVWVGAKRCARWPRRSASGAHRVKLNSVDERVLVDRAGVRGALAQRLAVGLAGSSDVLRGDRRERNDLDVVNLDLTGADPVATAMLDLRARPQSDRERNVSGQDVVAQLAAELHT
jgi:hypothetical protein